MDDLDDQLPRGDRLQHFLAGALLLHALDELAGDLEVDIGGEQGGAHFLECVRHVFFAQFADAAQVAQRTGQFVGEGLEHGK